MINWDGVAGNAAKEKAYYDTRKIVTPQNYGFEAGQWNMSDLILDEDQRKFIAYQILDGVDPNHKKAPGLLPLQDISGPGPFLFKLKVLTRQACVRDKDGHTIFASTDAYRDSAEEGDLLPEYGEQPQPGDVVEWKNQFREHDDERGRKVTNAVLREWAARGIRPESYVEFTVDADGCIMVPYPFVQMMLRKKGKELAHPKFRKRDKTGREKRRMINWWFKEVPRDYKAPKKRKKA